MLDFGAISSKGRVEDALGSWVCPLRTQGRTSHVRNVINIEDLSHKLERCVERMTEGMRPLSSGRTSERKGGGGSLCISDIHVYTNICVVF